MKETWFEALIMFYIVKSRGSDGHGQMLKINVMNEITWDV
jgi:hypothetical protein